MEIKILAPAKINLTLDVLGKRNDGYHEIATVMQAVDLYDTITLSDNDSENVTISCNYEDVPCDDSNICAKSAYRFFEYCKMDIKGVHIDIDKKIPTQAGLAGGSSDGAAVIFGLNKLFNVNLTMSEMCDIAGKVGADIPFCLVGGTMLATGIGTELKQLPPFECEQLLICKPDTVSVSTAQAYKMVDALNPHMPYTDKMVIALENNDMQKIITTLSNDFETALQIPEVNEIKSIMQNCNANGSVMSGSGSAVYGIFTSENDAQKCCDVLKATYPETFLCKPIKYGCQIIE